jgi:hypothetical protein
MLLAAEPGTLSVLTIVAVVALIVLMKGVTNSASRPFVIQRVAFHRGRGGLTNPASRPFVIGLLVLGGLGFFALAFVQVAARRSEDRLPQWNARQAEPPAPSVLRPRSSAMFLAPPHNTATAPAKQTKKGIFAALSSALEEAWKGQGHPAEKAAKPAKHLTATAEHDAAAPRAPAWVNAAPRMEGDTYLMSLHSDPYTTQMECERDLTRVLQAAVAEYAGLLLGREQAKDVQLPDDALQSLIRERWTETRSIEVAGASQDMLVLHVLIGFDPAMQQRFHAAAEHALVAQRLQGAGVVLAGVLGLLALVWGGLSAFGKRTAVLDPQETAMAAGNKGRSWPVLLVAGLIAALIVLAIRFLG